MHASSTRKLPRVASFAPWPPPLAFTPQPPPVIQVPYLHSRSVLSCCIHWIKAATNVGCSVSIDGITSDVNASAIGGNSGLVWGLGATLLL